jgi:hypothetical protein
MSGAQPKIKENIPDVSAGNALFPNDQKRAPVANTVRPPKPAKEQIRTEKFVLNRDSLASSAMNTARLHKMVISSYQVAAGNFAERAKRVSNATKASEKLVHFLALCANLSLSDDTLKKANKNGVFLSPIITGGHMDALHDSVKMLDSTTLNVSGIFAGHNIKFELESDEEVTKVTVDGYVLSAPRCLEFRTRSRYTMSPEQQEKLPTIAIMPSELFYEVTYFKYHGGRFIVDDINDPLKAVCDVSAINSALSGMSKSLSYMSGTANRMKSTNDNLSDDEAKLLDNFILRSGSKDMIMETPSPDYLGPAMSSVSASGWLSKQLGRTILFDEVKAIAKMIDSESGARIHEIDGSLKTITPYIGELSLSESMTLMNILIKLYIEPSWWARFYDVRLHSLAKGILKMLEDGTVYEDQKKKIIDILTTPITSGSGEEILLPRTYSSGMRVPGVISYKEANSERLVIETEGPKVVKPKVPEEKKDSKKD